MFYELSGARIGYAVIDAGNEEDLVSLVSHDILLQFLYQGFYHRGGGCLRESDSYPSLVH